MWNYMGWDNASTVAQEVENPQRNYPRAMIAAAILVAVTYILPLLAMALAGLSVDSFSTGDWMTRSQCDRRPAARLGRRRRRRHLRHRHVQRARDELHAPAHGHGRRWHAAAFCRRRNSRGVPWVSVLLCGLAWALALKLPFERLISIDLILYGSSLLLEFVALVVLRIREPKLQRPFKAGNLAFACSLGVGPAALIGYALYALARRRDLVRAQHRLVAGLLRRRRPAGPVALLAHRRPACAPPAGCRFRNRLVASPERKQQRPRHPHARPSIPRFQQVRLLCHLLLQRDGLRLAVLKQLCRPHHPVARIRRIVPALDLHPLAFKILIDGEEVRNLLQHVRIDIGVVPHIGVARIVLAHRQHFLVQHALVQHLQQPDRPHFLHASGKARPRHQHQHVQRIAVVAQRGGNESIVSRIVHRRVQVAVQLEDVQLLVIFKLVGSVLGDLDHRAKHLGGAVANRQFQIINHSSLHPLGGCVQHTQGSRILFRCASHDASMNAMPRLLEGNDQKGASNPRLLH